SRPTPTPVSDITAVWTPCEPPDGAGRATCGGSTTPTAASCGLWRPCAPRRPQSASNPKQSAARCSSASSTPSGAVTTGLASLTGMGGESRLVGPVPEGADPEAYDRLRRRVLWAMPSGLYVLGTRGATQRNLMTLNWATQVAVDPKLVAVSVEAT